MFDLLCRLASPRPDADRLGSGPGPEIALSRLVDRARDHALFGDLVRSLRWRGWPGVADETRRQLEAEERRLALRQLLQAGQLRAIAGALQAAGIPYAAFKGAALAIVLHGDVTGREYNDIDIIVPPDDVAAAEAVLADLGFRSRRGSADFRRAFLATQRQSALVRDDIDLAVDLHWSFSGAFLPFPLAAEEIWPSLRTIRIGGDPVATLCDADLALLLAGHGTKERWRSLGWVRDFACFLVGHRGLDWQALHARARRRRSGDSVLLACRMASLLLDVAPPVALAAPIAASRRVLGLADRLVADLRAERLAPGHLSDVVLCDRAVDRLRARLGIALAPTPGDAAALPLPPRLWPLYRVSRPFRLAISATGLLPEPKNSRLRN